MDPLTDQGNIQVMESSSCYFEHHIDQYEAQPVSARYRVGSEPTISCMRGRVQTHHKEQKFGAPHVVLRYSNCPEHTSVTFLVGIGICILTSQNI